MRTTVPVSSLHFPPSEWPQQQPAPHWVEVPSYQQNHVARWVQHGGVLSGCSTVNTMYTNNFSQRCSFHWLSFHWMKDLLMGSCSVSLVFDSAFCNCTQKPKHDYDWVATCGPIGLYFVSWRHDKLPLNRGVVGKTCDTFRTKKGERVALTNVGPILILLGAGVSRLKS